MQISEQNPYSNPLYYPDTFFPRQSIDLLFCLSPHEILPYVDQTFIQSSFAELLCQVWAHDSRTYEEKTHVIQKLAGHKQFEKSLLDLFTHDPIAALFIFVSIQEEETKKDFIQKFLDTKENYFYLAQCCCHIANGSMEDFPCHIKVIDGLLASLNSSQRKRLFHCFIRQSDLPTQANLLSMLRGEIEYSKQFIYRWGRVYESKENLKEYLFQFLQLFIQQFSDSSVEKPNLLYELIAFCNEEDFLSLTLEELPAYPPHIQSTVLNCLSRHLEEILDDLFKHFEPDDKRLYKYLDGLIDAGFSISKKIRIMKLFFERIEDSEGLRSSLNHIISFAPSAASLLWIALPDEEFSFLISEYSRTRRTKILRLSTTDSADPLNALIPKLYEYPERVDFILSICTLDIPSQTPMILDDEIFTSWLAFRDVKEYIEAGLTENILDDIMAFFQEDFQKVPSFLFAIGLRHAEHQDWIIQASRYCSKEQLKSIAQAIPPDSSIDIIERLSAQLMTHQIKLIFNHCPNTMFREYLTWKGEHLDRARAELTMLQNEMVSHLEMHVDHKETPDQFIQNCRAILLKQSKLLGGVETPIVKLLKEISLEKGRGSSNGIWKNIPSRLQVLDYYNGALNNSYSFIDKISVQKSQTVDFRLDDIDNQILKLIDANSWEAIGISTPTDLKHLGYQLDNQDVLYRYVQQPDLLAIWQFFKSLHLATLDDFITMCIAEPEELFDLKSIARKLEWQE